MSGINTRRLIIVTAVVLAISIALLYSMRSVVREAIIIPVSYWIWIIGLFIKSTPQVFFWGFALVIAFLVAWRSYFYKTKIPETVTKVPDYGSPTGRVSYWASRVELMRMGSYYQTTFNEALARLAIDLIGYRHRLPMRQIEKDISRGKIRLPQEIREFLQDSLFEREFKTVPYWVYVYRAIRLWWISHIYKARPRHDSISPNVRRLIKYMEEELEVNYDDNSL